MRCNLQDGRQQGPWPLKLGQNNDIGLIALQPGSQLEDVGLDLTCPSLEVSASMRAALSPHMRHLQAHTQLLLLHVQAAAPIGSLHVSEMDFVHHAGCSRKVVDGLPAQ